MQNLDEQPRPYESSSTNHSEESRFAPRPLWRSVVAGMSWALLFLLPLAGLMGMIFGCDFLGGRSQPGGAGLIAGIIMAGVISVLGLRCIAVALAGAIAGLAAWMLTKNPNQQRGLTMFLSVALTAFLLWLSGLF